MKKLLLIELSHENTPIAVREKAAFLKEGEVSTMSRIAVRNGMFLLSTCNRLTCCAYTDEQDDLVTFFSSLFSRDVWSLVKPYVLLTSRTEETARHLFATAAGLHSQVIGEHEILGQIRKAYAFTKSEGGLGPVMDEFVREAIAVGKRVRTNTDLGRHSASIASAAFRVIKDLHPDLSSKNILVVGTGKMSQLLTSIVLHTKAPKIWIASHFIERAAEAAAGTRAQPVDVNGIDKIFGEVDIVIGATDREVNFLEKAPGKYGSCTKEHLGMTGQKERLFIDLGLPRNFNQDLRKAPGCSLFDLDDIKALTQLGIKKRKEEALEANHLIEDEVKRYREVLANRELASLYGSHWKNLEYKKIQNLEWLRPKSQNMTEQQWAVVEKFAHRLIRSMSSDFIKRIREEVKNGKDSELLMSELQYLAPLAESDFSNNTLQSGEIPFVRKCS